MELAHLLSLAAALSWTLASLFGHRPAVTLGSLQFNRIRMLTSAGLLCVMMLVDSRIPAQKVDLEFMAWMGEVGLPFVIVFTKVDKLNKTERETFLPAYEAEMLVNFCPKLGTVLANEEIENGKSADSGDGIIYLTEIKDAYKIKTGLHLKKSNP